MNGSHQKELYTTIERSFGLAAGVLNKQITRSQGNGLNSLRFRKKLVEQGCRSWTLKIFDSRFQKLRRAPRTRITHSHLKLCASLTRLVFGIVGPQVSVRMSGDDERRHWIGPGLTVDNLRSYAVQYIPLVRGEIDLVLWEAADNVVRCWSRCRHGGQHVLKKDTCCANRRMKSHMLRLRTGPTDATILRPSLSI